MKFYVYELVDPRSGAPFYVGKGSGNRIDQHATEAARGMHSRKCDRIRELRAIGLEVEKREIAYFLGEQDAYDFETERIAEIGLANLTNVLPGGQRAWVERYELVAARRALTITKKKERAFGTWGRKWLAMVDAWPHGVTFPGLANGDAQADSLVAYVRNRVAELQ